MAIDNREAGTQAHREVSRRIHNFVAAAKTLVDHTRVFMTENYQKTSLFIDFNNEIKQRFEKNPVAKFVHDLRNYMLHRGLPNSEMFVFFSQDPESPNPNAQIKTGVKLNAEELIDWNGWTTPARSYLSIAGSELAIETFVDAYVSQVEDFQNWISERLFNFHARDMAELDALREEYAASERQSGKFQQINTDAIPTSSVESNTKREKFVIPKPIAIEINNIGTSLVAGIRKLNIPHASQNQFKSERHISATITPDKMIEHPIMHQFDENGNSVLAFILKQSDIYGFDNKSIDLFQQLQEKFLGVDSVGNFLSRKFIQKSIIKWCRSSFEEHEELNLVEALAADGEANTRHYKVWAPIAHLEIEQGFQFGPIEILPISAEMINGLEADGVRTSPNQESQIRALFDKIRNTMQGYAAVVVSLEAESERAATEGLRRANEAIKLLRFFSPAAHDASLYCPTSLLGADVIPTSHVLVLAGGNFTYSERNTSVNAAYWRMSKADLEHLTPIFDATSALIQATNLDEFENSLRSSMILFGTAATFREPSDRLMYALSAVESILLKHEMEPFSYSIGRRMALIFNCENEKSDEISRIVRAVYRIRGKHGSLLWSEFDRQILQEFILYSRNAILVALQNIQNFGRRSDFIDAIERAANPHQPI